MNELLPAPSRPSSVIRDPTVRAYRRRFFVVDTHVPARRAFTAQGAARIASRTPSPPWRSTLKRKWERQVEREAAHRRAVGYP